MTRQHVAIIGAGIVGVCTALELLADGHQVTLIEAGEPGGPQAASFGNGGWISPASVVPMSMPGLWRRVPAMLSDAMGPLTIRLSALPALMPWLLRFLASGSTVARVEATAAALATLLRDAPRRHHDLAARCGLDDLIVQSGLLYAYPDRDAFAHEALAWRLRRDNGVIWRELAASELHNFEPHLAPHYTFGALVEAGAHCRDPGAYVAGLHATAVAQGASSVKARATGFIEKAGRVSAVIHDHGTIACDVVVIAAGIRAAMLARQVGDIVPLASERGYHVVVPKPGFNLRAPVMPSDGKMANTSTTDGLRASGQVELASVDQAPNWERAAILLGHLKRTYPDLPTRLKIEDVPVWMGHRPSTPDALPVIGPSTRLRGVYHAFGHGHIGLATGPITGTIIAELVAGKQPTVPVLPFSVARFG